MFNFYFTLTGNTYKQMTEVKLLAGEFEKSFGF